MPAITATVHHCFGVEGGRVLVGTVKLIYKAWKEKNIFVGDIYDLYQVGKLSIKDCVINILGFVSYVVSEQP